jgi:molybdopterin-containing oxidoreductase family membrane subunit
VKQLESLVASLPQPEVVSTTSSKAYNAAIALFGLIAAVGVAFGIHAMIVGHEHVYNCTREIPWGLLISTYVFFVVTSTGLCIVSSIGHVFGFKAFQAIAPRAVFMAIATIVSGFLVIAFEIENPWRMAIYNVISPNLTSNIWWMGTLYGAYLFFMLIEFAMLLKGMHKQAAVVGLAGLLSGAAAHSNLGAVFGLLGAREFWHGPYMPIYFITSAAMSGCAAVLFFTWMAYKANGWKMSESLKNSLSAVGKLGLLLISIIMFFTTWKVLSGIAGHPPGKYEAMMALIKGPYAYNFWIGEILMGMVLPFMIIYGVKARNVTAMFVAGTLSVIGIFFMRYDLVLVGQIVPVFAEYNVLDFPEYLSYVPSFHEIIITAGGFAFCAMLFLMGEKIFKGHVAEEH